MDIKGLKNKLQEIIIQDNRKFKDVAKEIGIAQNTLRWIVSNKTIMNIKTAWKIEKWVKKMGSPK